MRSVFKERPDAVELSRRVRGFWGKVWVWWPVAFMIAVIACESTPTFSAEKTGGWIRPWLEQYFGHINDTLWYLVHRAIRKSGHFTGYGLVGLTWLRAWWLTLPRSQFFYDALLALLGTGLVASCDEWHQTYLPNRHGSPWDVLLDCSGAIALQLIVYVAMRSFKPKQLARAA